MSTAIKLREVAYPVSSQPPLDLWQHLLEKRRTYEGKILRSARNIMLPPDLRYYLLRVRRSLSALTIVEPLQ